MDQDYYQILGVHKHATAKEIKRAYYKQSNRCHPDKNSSLEAKEMLLKVQKAYKTLSDPDMKRAYDNMSAAEFEKWDYARQNPEPPRWSSWLSNLCTSQKPDESAQLNVHFEGQLYNVSVNLSDKIINTKFTLAAKTNIPFNNLRLFFGDVELEDDQKNHKHYRIPKVATLDAVRKSPPNNKHARPTPFNVQHSHPTSDNAYHTHSVPIVEYPDSPNAYPASSNNRPTYILLNNDYPPSPNDHLTPIVDYPDSPNDHLNSNNAHHVYQNSNIDYLAYSNVHSTPVFEYPTSPNVHFNSNNAHHTYPNSNIEYPASPNVHSRPVNAYSSSRYVHSIPVNAYPASVNNHSVPANDHLTSISVHVTSIYPTLPYIHSAPRNDYVPQNYVHSAPRNDYVPQNYSAQNNDFQRPTQKTHTYV
ncbi:Molecular chaperone DnaJ [Aphelenchoides bicaudatus]|nr:Molecular chaperone DnaJ [Aphelenchoides bicaudatus]